MPPRCGTGVIMDFNRSWSTDHRNSIVWGVGDSNTSRTPIHTTFVADTYSTWSTVERWPKHIPMNSSRWISYFNIGRWIGVSGESHRQIFTKLNFKSSREGGETKDAILLSSLVSLLRFLSLDPLFLSLFFYLLLWIGVPLIPVTALLFPTTIHRIPPWISSCGILDFFCFSMQFMLFEGIWLGFGSERW